MPQKRFGLLDKVIENGKGNFKLDYYSSRLKNVVQHSQFNP